MIRFYNGKILTLECFDIKENEEVWVKGNEICFAGKPTEEDYKTATFTREIDLDGNLLMPSFKDAHTHSAMTFLRSYADDMPLHEWLNNRVFPMEAKLTPEAVYTFTKIAILEYLSSGITASFDMYFNLDDYVKANIESGFRTVMCSSTNDFGGTAEQDEQDYLKYNSINELISYKFGLHAEYTTSPKLISEIVNMAHKYKEPVYAHNSETKSEVEDCIKRYGKTPTQYFNSLGMYEYGGGLYHGIYLDDKDLEIIKEKNLHVITNPASNAKLASGIADITKMINCGINLSIGTDGAASNNALDMFREMYLVSVLQKLKYMDASACSATDVLYMATVGGAKAMGLDDCDIIAKGKKADMIVIDLKRPNMQPINNIVKNIVFSGSKENIKLTMCNGKVLYEDSKFYIGEDINDIYSRANKLLMKIKNKDYRHFVVL